MAEDSPEAEAEGAGPEPQGEKGPKKPIDIQSLAYEVLITVNRALEARGERQLEEPDVRRIWW